MEELVKSEVRIDNKVDELQAQLKRLLRKIFQFGDDAAILNFGIYRIMNQKRAVIEQFIDRDLIDGVEKEFGKVSGSNKEAIKKELGTIRGEIRSTFGDAAIDVNDKFSTTFSSTPAGQKFAARFDAKKKELANADASLDHRKEVYNHIYQFFSRYYDNGDFMSMYRRSTRQKYSIPYNGEEVMLHWANKDQYYIKTGEFFNNYSFKIGNYNVHFQLSNAQITQNNTKAVEKRVFILKSEEPVVYEPKIKTLNAFFEYRSLKIDDNVSEGVKNLQEILHDKAEATILNICSEPGLNIALTNKVDEKNTLLRKHLTIYARLNTTDYFIHKRLKAFLTEELDFYIKNEMFHLDDLTATGNQSIEQYLNRVRVMKEISLIIIEFLSQIEDFQKKLFEKKKFVISSDYCMTLDHVPSSFYTDIIRNTAQIDEWKFLYCIGETSEQATLSGKAGNFIDEEYLKAHPYLVIDTKFFDQEFKDRLLATFDDLDDATGGLMVKSENWQALNLLQKRFEGEVKCIYIDPPYNTKKDGFLYKDNFFHSSWLSMLGNRLSLSSQLLAKKGQIGISNDDNESSRLHELCDTIFGSENFVGNLIWNTEGHTDNQYEIKINHEYVTLYCVDIKNVEVGYVIDPNTRDESNLWKGYAENSITKNGSGNPPSEVILPAGFPIKTDSISLPSSKIPNEFYKQIARVGYITRDLTQTYSVEYPIRKTPMKAKGGKLIEPCTVFSGWANVNKLKQFILNGFTPINEEDGILYFYLSEKGVIYYKKERTKARNIFSVMRNLGTTEQMRSELESMGITFSKLYPKPKQLIKYLVSVEGCETNDLVLDYFAGSGTTAHALISLNREDQGKRKYILVEMAEYFNSVIKPRIEKMVFSTEWKDGKPLNTDGISHIFKYVILEQYEDTLNNIEFIEDGTVTRTLEDFEGFFVRYMLDFETRESPCRLNIEKIENPFDYSMKITENNEIVDKKIDLLDTFNYLLGIHVKKILAFDNNGTKYRVVTGEKDQITYTIIWRTTNGLDLVADKKYIEETILPKNKAEKIFINADFYVEKAEAIEPVFQTLMGA